MPANERYNRPVEHAWDANAFGYVPASATANPYGVGYLRAPRMHSGFARQCAADGYATQAPGDVPFGAHVRYAALYPVRLFRDGRAVPGERVSHADASRADPSTVILHGRATRDDPRRLLRNATGQGEGGAPPDQARRALWANAQWNPHAQYDPPSDLSHLSVLVYLEFNVMAGGHLISRARDHTRLCAYGLGERGDRQRAWNVQTHEAMAYRESSTFWYARVPARLYARAPRADTARQALVALLDRVESIDVP
jgi:hypothetical protein